MFKYVKINTKYINDLECRIEFGKYHNGQTAITLIGRCGEVVCRATSALDGVKLKKDQVILKTYSENEGIIEELIRLKIIKSIDRYTLFGHSSFPVCTLETAHA